MKKVLFATTALVATAGVAQADVALSGGANFGVVNNGTDAGMDNAYNNASVTATMSGATDNGLTFGASMTVRVGDDVDLDVGDLGDNDNTAAEITAGTQNDGDITALSDTSFGNIFVSGDFGTLTFDRGGIDNLMNDDFSHDIQYGYSAGGWTIGLTADIDNNDGAYADGEEWSASIGYSMDALTVTLKTDDSGESDTTVSYAINDMLTATLNYDTDGQTVNLVTEAETTVTVAYAADGLSASLSLLDDDDDSWAVSLGYTMGALTLGAALGEDGDGDDTEMDLTASYDLGGGLSLKAATNETGAFFVGGAMSF